MLIRDAVIFRVVHAGCCCMLWSYNKVAAQCLVLYTLFSQDIKAQL